jgi:hypothetical protein
VGFGDAMRQKKPLGIKMEKAAGAAPLLLSSCHTHTD